MRYNRNTDKAESSFLIMESMKEEDAFPREVELLMWKHSPIDVTIGVLDAWLEEANKKYLVRGCQCYKLDSPEAKSIIEDDNQYFELMGMLRGAGVNTTSHIDEFAFEDF